MLVWLLGLILGKVWCVTKVLKLSIADFASNCDTVKLTIFYTGKKKDVSWHIMLRKVIGNMTFWVTKYIWIGIILDVSYYISKQLGNLSRIMPVPMNFLLEMSCLQLHFLFMILQEISLSSLRCQLLTIARKRK